jgi:hypothetical protein
MKLTTYIKNYLLNDIILMLAISGITYLILYSDDENDVKNETAIEIVPLNIHTDDEIG